MALDISDKFESLNVTNIKVSHKQFIVQKHSGLFMKNSKKEIIALCNCIELITFTFT